MSTIMILGGTGKVGTHLINELLAVKNKFETIKVVVRTDAKLSPDVKAHAQIHIIKEQFTKENLGPLLKDCNIVVSTLGHVKGSPDNLLLNTATIVLSEMKQPGKFIQLLGAIVHNDQTDPSHESRAMRLMKYLYALSLGKKVVQDLTLTMKYVRDHNGQVETVTIRPPQLTNGPKTGNYKIGKHLAFEGKGAAQLSRADLAALMAKLTFDEALMQEFKGSSPMIYTPNKAC